MFILIYKFFLNNFQIFEFVIFIFLNIIVLNCFMSFFVKNPVYSLIYLIVNYFIVGFIFILNSLIFLGLIFMLIYIGAVSILLLFTFMLLNIKVIYFNNIKKNYIVFCIYATIVIEVFFFFLFFSNYDIMNYENSFFINWFEIYNIKNDLNTTALKMYFENSSLVLISSTLLLMALLASVNIVNSLKSSKKQKAYIQLKGYKVLISK